MIEIGKPAPKFSLADQDGKTVKLDDFAGKWVVLYFYPKDDTPGCTCEANEFTSLLKDFAKLDGAILGCSPDDSESHKKFEKKYNLAIRLLADPEKKTIQDYGAWGEKVLYGKKSMGVIRSTFLIDPKKKIAHAWTKVKAEGHAEEVRNKLEELRGA